MSRYTEGIHITYPWESWTNKEDEAKEKARSLQKTANGEFVPSDYRLQALVRQFRANGISKRLKEDITEALRERPVEPDIWRRRARLLLQSAGWLDMDKFIQHRPPLEEVGFWKRPTPPQRKPARASKYLPTSIGN